MSFTIKAPVFLFAAFIAVAGCTNDGQSEPKLKTQTASPDMVRYQHFLEIRKEVDALYKSVFSKMDNRRWNIAPESAEEEKSGGDPIYLDQQISNLQQQVRPVLAQYRTYKKLKGPIEYCEYLISNSAESHMPPEGDLMKIIEPPVFVEMRDVFLHAGEAMDKTEDMFFKNSHATDEDKKEGITKIEADLATIKRKTPDWQSGMAPYLAQTNILRDIGSQLLQQRELIKANKYLCARALPKLDS